MFRSSGKTLGVAALIAALSIANVHAQTRRAIRSSACLDYSAPLRSRQARGADAAALVDWFNETRGVKGRISSTTSCRTGYDQAKTVQGTSARSRTRLHRHRDFRLIRCLGAMNTESRQVRCR